jgi:beta-glucanase (GH16 family)
MKKNTLIIALLLFVPFLLSAKDYKGAELRTNESFLYGRFEVRMKSAAGSGIVSSFFTFYDQPDFPTNWNEIDVEILGRYNNEVQFNAIEGKHQMHEHRQPLSFNPHEDFHTYAFDWTPEYIAWSVDGQEVYRQSGDHVARMNRPQKIMMNLWISEFYDWTGPWDESVLPKSAEYDFVKYYEYKKDKTFKLKWADEFDTWDVGRWSAASHTFDGNKVDFTSDNIQFKKGKLILSLTKETISYVSSEEEDKGSVGKGVIQEVKLADPKHVIVTFSGNTYAPYAKKKCFKVDGKEPVKTKLHRDLRTVDLYFEEPLNEAEQQKLEYSGPGMSLQEVEIQK